MQGERLDAYHFYEREWAGYDELRDAFEWAVPERFNLADYVCDRWADDADGDRIALYGDAGDGARETYTYRELAAATDRLAGHLAARGIGRGDRVGVNAPQRPETAIAHIACWKLGAVSIPLSTLFGTDALRYRLTDADADACIVDGSNVDTLRAVRDDLDLAVVTIDADARADEIGFEAALAGADPVDGAVDSRAEDDAIVIYTSGTTGEPKGVRHAHRVLLGHLPLFVTGFCNLDVRDADVFWTPAEWAWVATLFDVLFPGLFYGQSVVARGGQFDPETAFATVERYGVTNFFAPPTALRMMTDADPSGYDLSSVRVVPSGGESLGASIVEWAAETFDGAAVHEGYGQTEANMLVGDCTALAEFREGTIGPPAPGHEVAILDRESRESLPAGEVGEIAVRYEGNPVCFKSYLGKPEATRAKRHEGWLLTEDLGRTDAEGYVTFVGRADSVIISAGYRIGPVEIEEALASHPDAADAGVIGVPDDERGEVPKAFVVPASAASGGSSEERSGGESESDGVPASAASGGSSAEDRESDGVPANGGSSESGDPGEDLAAALRDHVRERLAAYEYPREIEFVEELPKTTTGKLRRVALEEREGLREGR